MLKVQSGTAELRREIARRASSEIGQRQQDWESLGLAKGRIYIEGDNDLLVPGPRLNLAAQRFSKGNEFRFHLVSYDGLSIPKFMVSD